MPLELGKEDRAAMGMDQKALAVEIGIKNIHVLVKDPAITASPTTLAIFFGLLPRIGFGRVDAGVEMAGCEQQFLSVGRKVGTRCATATGADERRFRR